MRITRLSIRGRLLLLMLGLVLPLVAAGFLNLWSFWSVSRASLDESLVRQAQLAAAAFEQQLIGHRQTLENIAFQARGGIENNAALRDYLDLIIATRPEWLDIQIVDRNRKVIVARSQASSGIPPSSISGTESDAARENNFVVLADQAEGTRRHFFSLSQPIGNGNFVIARVDAATANAIFENLVLPDENVIAVYDFNNRLVYRNQELPEYASIEGVETPFLAALNEKREGIIESKSPYDGIERVYGLARVKTGNYLVVVGVPRSRLYETTVREFAKHAFSGLLIASLAVVAALGFSRTMVKPLQELIETAKSFGEGDNSARANVADEGPIGELGSTFNRMADQIADREERLKELDRLKSEFVSSVSHELRTPLTTIKTLAHVLRSDKISASERSEYLQTIAEECDRQIDFVRNLLDLSRLEAGAFPFVKAEVNVADLLRELFEANEPAAESRNLRLSFSSPADPLPLVVSDPAVLKQAISSILGNSMKYTPENGSIKLSSRFDELNVYIEIVDNGCGIAESDIPNIFTKFYRGSPLNNSELSEGEGTATDIAGVGLGLYLVQNLIGQIGGKIFVQSPVEGTDRGTAFTISLPIANRSRSSAD